MTDRKDEKQAILGRIREALAQPTDAHVRANTLATSHSLPVIQNLGDRSPDRSDFMPPVGANFQEKVALFAELSDRLQTEFHVVDSIEAATIFFTELAKENGWTRIGRHQNDTVHTICSQVNIDFLETDGGYDASEMEKCDAGVTACEALIAQTASVLITNGSSGGRALSVLPPHHVVIATADQMIGSMVDGYRLLHQRYGEGRWPSFISYITGPSRTADVERVLVLGAHGPKRLTVIMIASD